VRGAAVGDSGGAVMTFDPARIVYRWVVAALLASTILSVGFTEWDPAEVVITIMLSGVAGLIFGLAFAYRAAVHYAHWRRDHPRVEHSHVTVIVEGVDYLPPGHFDHFYSKDALG